MFKDLFFADWIEPFSNQMPPRNAKQKRDDRRSFSGQGLFQGLSTLCQEKSQVFNTTNNHGINGGHKGSEETTNREGQEDCTPRVPGGRLGAIFLHQQHCYQCAVDQAVVIRLGGDTIGGCKEANWESIEQNVVVLFNSKGISISNHDIEVFPWSSPFKI